MGNKNQLYNLSNLRNLEENTIPISILLLYLHQFKQFQIKYIYYHLDIHDKLIVKD